MRVVCAVMLASCNAEGPSTPEEAPAKPVLRIGGAASMLEGLLPALTETHTRTRGTMAFELQSSSTSDAIAALVAGDLDLAAATRPAAPVEASRAVERNWDLTDESVRHIVGVDVTAVAVHPTNLVEALTYDQVIGVFCTHTVDDWSFLGQPAGPIRALTLPPSSGDRALFEDFFCGPVGIHEDVVLASADQVEEALRTDPSAISYVSMSKGDARFVPLQPDPAGPPVVPSQENIINGSYPLYRDVYLFSGGPAAGYVDSFLVWIASPAGQEVVDEQRFVPLFLRPERLDEPRPLRETIHFDAGKAVPNQRSMARLELLIDELKQRAIAHVVLEGYTDDQEGDPYVLSESRANAVKELIASKLPKVYFEIIPRGPKHALAPNDTPYGRLRNRRVQIYLAADERRSGDAVVVEGNSPDGGG